MLYPENKKQEFQVLSNQPLWQNVNLIDEKVQEDPVLGKILEDLGYITRVNRSWHSLIQEGGKGFFTHIPS